MDPLSLLAELYGDGRLTVEKFRLHRLTGLEEICVRKPKDLARLLHISERSANKILSEAREMLQGKLFVPEKSMRGMESQAAMTPGLSPDASNGSGHVVPAPGPGPEPDAFKTEVLDMLAKRFP